MSAITEARALLQRVREGATPGPWTASWSYREPGRLLLDVAEADGAFRESDANLIVLLAGNPVLLDAIDGMLRQAEGFPDDVFRPHAERIASALVQQGKAMGL